MAKNKKTTEQFVAEAKEVWGDRWDYSKTEYVRAADKVIITCLEHGDFSQVARLHLRGYVGCGGCNGRGNGLKSFLAKSLSKWGDRWDYSKTNYVNNYEKVTITCRDHGDFLQTPRRHYEGVVGCPRCSGRYKTLEDFVYEATKVWEDRWDYSMVSFKNQEEKVSIVCKEHGEFKQSPYYHLKGFVGCSKCSNKISDTEEFIDRAKNVWSEDLWDYSKAEFKNLHSKISVVCRRHGRVVQQIASSHLKGRNPCPECTNRFFRNTEDFISDASRVWGDRWDYSNTEFKKIKGAVSITCRDHGEFTQLADNHLRGFIGCRPCSSVGESAGESEVKEFLLSIGVPTERKYVKSSDGKRYEIDMYSEKYRVGVEYNGVYWHSEARVPSDLHLTKTVLARRNGIRLVHVWEDDWRHRRSIVEEHLSRIYGKSTQPRIPARTLRVRPVVSGIALPFLERTHIQGGTSATYYIGGFHEGELVALACFKKRGEDYELVRYATSAIVQGGHSKLVSYFEKNYSYQNLITFADLTFSDGGLYKNTGWIEDKVLNPDYQYLVNGVRKHKFGYRIERFKRDPNLKYVEGMSERKLAKLNGLLRVYDAGKIRFIKPHP